MMNDHIYQFLLSTLKSSSSYREGVKACCPFHDEDTPSFFVFHADTPRASGWFFKCHGCRKSGSLYYLVKHLNGAVDQVLKPIYDHSYTRRDVEETTRYFPDATRGMISDYSYYMARGISSEVCAKFGFKAVPLEPSVVMPVYTRYKYKGYVKRSLDPFIKYRYMLQPGGDFEDALWGWDAITDKTAPTIVTEGIIDAACWWTAGYQAVALVTGKKWEGKSEYLEQLRDAFYVPDNGDSDSFDSFLRLHMRNPGKMVFIPPEYKDTSDVVGSQGINELARLIQKANGQT